MKKPTESHMYKNDLNQEDHSTAAIGFGKPMQARNISLSSNAEFPKLKSGSSSSKPKSALNSKAQKQGNITMSNVASILNNAVNAEDKAKEMPTHSDEVNGTSNKETNSTQIIKQYTRKEAPNYSGRVDASPLEPKDRDTVSDGPFILSIENVKSDYEKDDVYDLLDHPYGQIVDLQEERCQNKTLKLTIA